MSIGLLVFASVSEGTAWIVDSLFDCNLDAWTFSVQKHCNHLQPLVKAKNAWEEVLEFSVENSLFWYSGWFHTWCRLEHFNKKDVGTISAQDPSMVFGDHFVWWEHIHRPGQSHELEAAHQIWGLGGILESQGHPNLANRYIYIYIQ